MGVPGLEPGTSSLSAKRSNRLSYTPVEQIREYRTATAFSNRLLVGESDQQSTGEADREVVEDAADRAQRCADNHIQ